MLGEQLRSSRNLWNECLAFTKQFYSDFDMFPSKKTLCEFSKHNGMYAQASRAVTQRLHDSIFRMVKLRKKGLCCGFPRFKNCDRMKSIYYPQLGFKLVGKRLRVTPFGDFAVRGFREMSGELKTLSLKREQSGKWFAVLVYDTPAVPFVPNGGPWVGVDLGLENLATLSDGKIVPNPRHADIGEELIVRRQRQLSRKKRGSRNFFKAKRRLAIAHELVVNKRSDYLHKTTRGLVGRYGLIALENLNIGGLACGLLASRIHDASWGEFVRQLKYKAVEAGCSIVEVDAKNTSQDCWACGHRQFKALSERTHRCDVCGFEVHRDLNAAKNILARVTPGFGGNNAFGNGAAVLENPMTEQAASMKKEARSVE